VPILQSEFFGGPVFVGNPELEMSSLENYDLRADYEPYEGGLMSVSWFNKDVKDAIEYVQKVGTFTYTTAKNYPTGELSGFELEVRQRLASSRKTSRVSPWAPTPRSSTPR
jgi:outer membrane receptor for ferrienterochelin and colicin